jgi:IclR family transcriptional regulator, acetate operon repressor
VGVDPLVSEDGTAAGGADGPACSVGIVVNGRGARDNSVHSVDRAISILQVLARHGAAGVTEIAAEVDVHKSTVSRLLGTLEARGLVEQSSNRGRYRLGYGVVQLAAGATRKHAPTAATSRTLSARRSTWPSGTVTPWSASTR